MSKIFQVLIACRLNLNWNWLFKLSLLACVICCAASRSKLLDASSLIFQSSYLTLQLLDEVSLLLDEF